MKITVLCGGGSTERQVSLVSGCSVAEALTLSGHEVLCLDVFSGEAVTSAPTISPEPPSELRRSDGYLFSPSILPLCLESDCVFLALHGGAGENGQLQALFDCYGITYTGSGYVPSLLCMDKGLTSDVLRSNGIPVPLGITVNNTENLDFGIFPACVKPACSGSSVGVSFPCDPDSLRTAVKEALCVCPRVRIEEKLNGRELTVGILNGEALPVVEILPRCRYDYESKYDPTLASELCPAPLTSDEEAAVKSVAKAAAKALLVDSYCRVDLILSGGVPYCLEINTLPGMTKTSLLPLAARTAGISFPELCSIIAESSFKKRI